VRCSRSSLLSNVMQRKTESKQDAGIRRKRAYPKEAWRAGTTLVPG
jgi:hypothetical protein